MNGLIIIILANSFVGSIFFRASGSVQHGNTFKIKTMCSKLSNIQYFRALPLLVILYIALIIPIIHPLAHNHSETHSPYHTGEGISDSHFAGEAHACEICNFLATHIAALTLNKCNHSPYFSTLLIVAEQQVVNLERFLLSLRARAPPIPPPLQHKNFHYNI